jgi:hypothetical protein
MFTFESYPADICESQTVAIATAIEEIMWNLYRLNERIFSSWQVKRLQLILLGVLL